MTTWTQEVSYYTASYPVSFPTNAYFTYCVGDGMGNENELACLRTNVGINYENVSKAVIVIGDNNTDRYILAGALTAWRSHSIFRAIRRGGRFTEIRVEQPEIRPGETPEELIVLEGNDWRKLLIEYAEKAAERNGVQKFDTAKNITGYCTWYYYYKDVTGQNLLDNVKALAENRDVYAAEYVQIDDGYQSWQGDWLTRDKDWPFTLEEAANNITSKGMKAGIWLMPFVASTASETYKAHKDWFVTFPETGETITSNGWTPPPDNKWCCIDSTNPEAREHIANVFRAFRKMGYTYFKLDGLAFGFARGKRMDPNATSVSSFRLLMKTIREAVPDCVILACGPHYLPCLGVCDNARAGHDTGRYWNYDSVAVKNPNVPLGTECIVNAMHSTLTKFWMVDRWFRMDPDALMARQDNAFYTIGEARVSVVTGIMTGVCITSDCLATIAPERLALLGKAQKYRMRDCMPLLHSNLNRWPQVFEGTIDGKRAIVMINDSEQDMEYTFEELQLPKECVELLTDAKLTERITLPPHDAALLTA